MEDTMIIFAKRAIELFVKGASQTPPFMTWPM